MPLQRIAYMKFVHPEFLWALSLLIVPIIIHLFHFRRYKKIEFTNVAFLKELQKETRSYQKLRNIIVLISRMFAISFLVLAFAQPYIPGSDKQDLSKTENVFIYVDNSFSMQALSSEGPLIEVAREKARSVIKAFGNTQEFRILTNDDRSTEALNKDDALAAIDEIGISPFQQNMEDVAKGLGFSASRNPAERNHVFWISDFQERTAETVSMDTNFSVHLIPLRSSSSVNVGIDSAWLEDPVVQLNKQIKLKVRLHNYGQEDITNASLGFLVNGRSNSVLGFEIPAGATDEVVIDYLPSSAGWKELEVKIEDKDVYFDDSWKMSLHVREKVGILEIRGDGAPDNLSSLFATDSYFEHNVVSEGNIRVSSFSELDFIILNEVNELGSGMIENLAEFVRKGGSLLVIPGEQPESGDVNTLCEELGLSQFGELNESPSRVSSLALEDPIFDKVFDRIPENPDYPVIEKYFELHSGGITEQIMSMTGNTPFLQYANEVEGKAFQITVPLLEEYSNFQKHALFIPVILKMAFNRSVEFPLSYTLTQPMPLIRGTAGLPNLQSNLQIASGDEVWVPVVQAQGGRSVIDLGDDLNNDGFYRLTSEDSLLQTIAINYDRSESSNSFIDEENFPDRFKVKDLDVWSGGNFPIAAQIEEIRFGKRFWKTCVWLSLLFLAIEILLLRLWTKETQGGAKAAS